MNEQLITSRDWEQGDVHKHESTWILDNGDKVQIHAEIAPTSERSYIVAKRWDGRRWERVTSVHGPHMMWWTTTSSMTIAESLVEDVAHIIDEVNKILPRRGSGSGRVYTHGSNADCPDVQSGKWTRCLGHR